MSGNTKGQLSAASLTSLLVLAVTKAGVTGLLSLAGEEVSCQVSEENSFLVI